MQQRLVEPGLEFLRHDQHPIHRAVELLSRAALGEPVHVRLGQRYPGAIIDLPGKRDQGPDLRVALLPDVGVDVLLVPDRMQPGGGHDHRLGQPAHRRRGVGAEMLDDDLGLLRQVVGVQGHEPGDRPPGLTRVVLRVL